MRKSIAAVAVLLLIAGSFVPFATVHGQPVERNASSRLVGTWRLVSGKYDQKKDESDVPKEMVRLRIISPTHFCWAQYPADSGEVKLGAGGTYTLEGNTYTESVDFAGGPGAKELIGKKASYTCKLTGNQWHHSGTLPNGGKIEEVWERVEAGTK